MARSRRRRGRRIRVQHPIFFETADQTGTGTMTLVSYSGACVEAAEVRLTRSERVRLFVWPQRHAEPFELAGVVASLRSDGFGIAFERTGQEVSQWIDALPAAPAAEPSPHPDESAD
jgi:hypothetical protein